MSRSKELVKNTAILTIGKMCTQFVSFLLLPLYTALLSTEEYGIVDLFTTYIALILPLVCWQLDQGILLNWLITIIRSITLAPSMPLRRQWFVSVVPMLWS